MFLQRVNLGNGFILTDSKGFASLLINILLKDISSPI